MLKTLYITLYIILLPFVKGFCTTWQVGQGKPFQKINTAITACQDGDTIFVFEGIYKEYKININKKIMLIGVDYPIIDGQKHGEIISITADSVVLQGFVVKNSGVASLYEPSAINAFNVRHVKIENNILEDNFFGIYIQQCTNILIRRNRITAYGKVEQSIGNGIHCWKSDNLQIVRNDISGHRDGIYFEFVANSIIFSNISKKNLRYGLHFMFSNDDTYVNNYFEANGAGLAVMYSKKVAMYNNTFKRSNGDASYGILLKELSDAEIIGNTFENNTSALFLEGANRIMIKKNRFLNNGWALKIQANCMDNIVEENNFQNNTFDVSTNGTLVLSKFKDNYWDRYEGYDLDNDNKGDIPYRPLSLYSIIIDNNPIAMLLYRSFMVTLLDRTEKLIPSITPEDFRDDYPRMKPHDL
ncbi:MAG: nitrous oxide reductase family maturation protein NosD [Saprospiraceae bacterium]